MLHNNQLTFLLAFEMSRILFKTTETSLCAFPRPIIFLRFAFSVYPRNFLQKYGIVVTYFDKLLCFFVDKVIKKYLEVFIVSISTSSHRCDEHHKNNFSMAQK